MKVGDYVRTIYGIAKVEEDRKIKFGLIHPVIDILKKEAIIKSSPNIIDLIEVGDYVNGEKIIKIGEDHCGRKILVYGFNDGRHQVANAIYEEDIKSIVTKEQFESIKYKVK